MNPRPLEPQSSALPTELHPPRLELRDIFIVPLTRRQLFRAGLDSPLNFSTASRIAPSSTIAEASGHCPSGGRRSSFGTDCTTRAHPGSGWLYIRRLARTSGTTPGAAGALPRLAEALKLLAVADPQDLTCFAGPLVLCLQDLTQSDMSDKIRPLLVSRALEFSHHLVHQNLRVGSAFNKRQTHDAAGVRLSPSDTRLG